MSEEAIPVVEIKDDLEDWNVYANIMRRRALSRLLALALREVTEGRVRSGLRLVTALHDAGEEIGKPEFEQILQRLLSANQAEAREELEQLQTNRTIEQLIAPLTGRR